MNAAEPAQFGNGLQNTVNSIGCHTFDHEDALDVDDLSGDIQARGSATNASHAVSNKRVEMVAVWNAAVVTFGIDQITLSWSALRIHKLQQR